MLDAEYATHRDRVQALMPTWSVPLLLGWKVTHEFVRDAGDFLVNDELKPNTVASCSADWRYLSARIRWNVARVAEQDDEELEWVMVHECCHALINELREGREDWLDHEEHVASLLANVFIRIGGSEHA